MNHLNSIPAGYWLAFSFLCSLLCYLYAQSDGYWRGWHARDNDADCPPRRLREPNKNNEPEFPKGRTRRSFLNFDD